LQTTRAAGRHPETKFLADIGSVPHDFRMRQLDDFSDSVAIVVSSCDAFFDAWRPFTFFFRKFWNDCPFQTFLIVNELRVRSRLFTPVAVGPDRGWASNLRVALQQIDRPYVLYVQEDYFLTGPVDREQLAADLAYVLEHDADSLCFRARSDLDPGFKQINERFGIVPRTSDGRTRCQVTLWKREALTSILREGENAWEMESRGSERTQEMLVLSYSRRENSPVPYLMSAITRGLWTAEAIAMCREHGVDISPQFRAQYSVNSVLRRFRRALTRRRLQRELSLRKNREIDIDP
jgi:hypothetical protein